jgi:hypothetical protein
MNSKYYAEIHSHSLPKSRFKSQALSGSKHRKWMQWSRAATAYRKIKEIIVELPESEKFSKDNALLLRLLADLVKRLEKSVSLNSVNRSQHKFKSKV